MRCLLGVAEAGFFPGIIYYMSQWFPSPQRARAISRFMIAVPLAGMIGNPLGGLLLGVDGRLGLRGWQWLFLVEGIPSLVLGFSVFVFLTDRIEDAHWLTDEQRTWLTARIRREHTEIAGAHGVSALRTLVHPTVWILAVSYFLIQAASYGYNFWGPTIIRDALQSSTVMTGLVSGGIAVLAAASMLASGASSDRTGERPLHSGVTTLVGAAGYVGVALLPNPIARVAALAVAWMGLRAYVVPFWCMPSMLLGGTAAASGIALVNSIGNIGGFVGPYIIGAIKDATGGIAGGLLVLAATAVVGALLLLVVRRHPAFATHGSAGSDSQGEVQYHSSYQTSHTTSNQPGR
jgi:MFS family permease